MGTGSGDCFLCHASRHVGGSANCGFRDGERMACTGEPLCFGVTVKKKREIERGRVDAVARRREGLVDKI